MKKKLVSVVLPSYNHESFVAQAIESVFAQTYPRIELIIVDDGSRDRSCETIEGTLSRLKDKRPLPVKFLRTENCGAHAAINRGLREAQGEFLTILNSDDFYHPQRLEVLVQAAERGEARLLFSLLDIVGPTGERLSAGESDKVFWYHESISLRHYFPSLGFALLKDNLAATSGNLFFTRELYEKVGEFSSYRYTHDADYLLRCLRFTEPRLISRVLLYYRIHGRNTILDSQAQVEVEGRKILLSYFDSMVSPPEGANRFAPCQAFWPHYFENFVRQNRPFFAPQGKIADYLGFATHLRALGAEKALAVTGLESWVGKKLETLPHRARVERGLSVQVRQAEAELGRAYIVRLEGLTAGEDAPPLALVSGGEVLAVARSFRMDNGIASYLLVASGARAGEEPQFVPIGGGKDPALEVSSEYLVAEAELEWAAPFLGPNRVRYPSRSYPVTAVTEQGSVESLRLEESGWTIEGWSIDRQTGDGPVEVIAFAGRRRFPLQIARGPTRGIGLSSRGGTEFQVSLTPSAFRKLKPGTKLRLYAIFQRGFAISLLSATVGPDQGLTRDAAIEPLSGGLRVAATQTGWKVCGEGFEREWTSEAGPIGFIDYLDPAPECRKAVGWAFDPKRGEVPEAFLLCRGDQPVSLVPPNWERPDIAQAYEAPSPLIAGFNLPIGGETQAREVQAFALWKSGTATRLEIYRGGEA